MGGQLHPLPLAPHLPVSASLRDPEVRVPTCVFALRVVGPDLWVLG